MRAELITVLKTLTKDQQYDIATHLANNIGYKLVEKPRERIELWINGKRVTHEIC